MGKRELVLIVAFALVGILVYQFTAPPLQPGQEGFSISRMLRDVRRGISGQRVQGAAQTTRTEAIDNSITELRVNVRILDLTVTGEDRSDVLFDMRVQSSGADEADAKQLAQQTTLKVDRAGGGLLAAIDFPNPGVQRATLTVHMPRRLALRVESKSGRLEASGVASADIKGNRGQTKLSDIPGDVTLNHRAGELSVDTVGSLRLDSVGGSGTVAHVRGACSFSLTRTDLTARDIVGPLDLKNIGGDVKLRELASLKPPFSADTQSGSIDIEGLRTEGRIDARRTGLTISLDRPVALAVYSTGDDIRLTPPSAGYTIDAIATEGTVEIEDGAVKPTGDDREQRAAGPVRGGGPTLTLRATRADIKVSRS